MKPATPPIWLLAIGLLCVTTPALANTGGDPMDHAFARYRDCTRDAALRLDRDNVQADATIRSAESACLREHAQLIDAANRIPPGREGITYAERATQLLALQETNRQILARLIAFQRENHAPNQ